MARTVQLLFRCTFRPLFWGASLALQFIPRNLTTRNLPYLHTRIHHEGRSAACPLLDLRIEAGIRCAQSHATMWNQVSSKCACTSKVRAMHTRLQLDLDNCRVPCPMQARMVMATRGRGVGTGEEGGGGSQGWGPCSLGDLLGRGHGFLHFEHLCMCAHPCTCNMPPPPTAPTHPPHPSHAAAGLVIAPWAIPGELNLPPYGTRAAMVGQPHCMRA
jgi:hypothetical protein